MLRFIENFTHVFIFMNMTIEFIRSNIIIVVNASLILFQFFFIINSFYVIVLKNLIQIEF